MPTLIPASLLNIQFHSITNLALGIICFIFQVVNLMLQKWFVFNWNFITYTDCCLGLESA